MFVERNKKCFEHHRCDMYVILSNKYTCQGYAPLYFLTFIYKHFGANAPILFMSKIIYKGQSPDMFVE